MKTILTTIMFLLVSSQAWAATKLEPVDYLESVVMATDGNVVYERTNTGGANKLYSVSDSLSAPVLVFDFSAINLTVGSDVHVVTGSNIILDAMRVCGSSLVVSVVDFASNKYFLLRSVDGGAHWGNNYPAFDNLQPIVLLGDRDGTFSNQIAGVQTLSDRGILYDTASGRNRLVVGEYNVAAGRVAGGTKDQVRLMSYDFGTNSTSELTHWNTGGIRQIRHIHAVKQDPYTGYIYVCAGESEAGIFRWDGTTAIPVNTVFSAYGFPYVWNSAQYRVVDILFRSDGYMIAMSDNSESSGTSAQRGIFKIAKDLSTYVQVDSHITAYNGHSGYFGLVATDGTMIYCDMVEAGASSYEMHIYTSSDSGETWVVTNRWGGNYSNTAINNSIFQILNFKNQIWMSGNGCGKRPGNTVSHTVVSTTAGVFDPFVDEWPIVLHPAYWVSTTGVDAASPQGYRPSAPWATVSYSLTGNRITNGGRVIVGAGTHNTNQIVSTFNANTQLGTPTAVTVIEGVGQANTVIKHLSTDTSTDGISVAQAMTPFVVKKLKWYSEKVGTGAVITVNAQATQKGAVYLRDMAVGDINFQKQYAVSNSQWLDIKRTTVTGPADAFNNGIIATGANATTTTIANSLFLGLKRGLYFFKPTGTATIYNATFSGYSLHGVITDTGATWVPTIKNCIFSPGVSAVADIIDNAGLTETDTNYDYNLYVGSLGNIANGGGTHRLYHVDPLLSPTYHLLPASPAIGAGANTPITGILSLSDRDGRPITDPTGAVFSRWINGVQEDNVDMGANQYPSDGMAIGDAGATGGYFNDVNPYVWSLPSGGGSIAPTGAQNRDAVISVDFTKQRLKIRATDGIGSIVEKLFPLGQTGGGKSGWGW